MTIHINPVTHRSFFSKRLAMVAAASGMFSRSSPVQKK